MPLTDRGSRGSNSSLDKQSDVEQIDTLNASSLPAAIKQVDILDEAALKEAAVIKEAPNG
jgi:hypothetical protein